MEDIEPRILYSADSAALGIDFALITGSGSDVLTETSVLSAAQEQTSQVSQQQTEVVSQLVVLDASLGQLDTLVADLQDQQNNGAPVDWLVIERDEDGISVVRNHLEQTATPYGAIHLITHGSDGRFELGSETVDTSTLQGRAGDFAAWSIGLSDEADLLIYGCDLAASEVGQMLMNAVSILTGADVSASDDETGHVSFGGDWILEYQVGDIQASVPFSAQLTDQWVNQLAITLTGSEQVVNETISGRQEFQNNHGGRQIATNGTDTVIVWQHQNDQDIYFRLYSADGTAKPGGEQLVANTGGIQREEPAVAIASNGDFIIVWTSKTQDGDKDGVYAQRFNADGTPKARPSDAYTDAAYANNFEFRVNSITAEEQRRAAVAMRDDGSFLIGWENHYIVSFIDSYRAMYRAFEADGSATNSSDQLAFSNITNNDQRHVAVAAGPNGEDALLAFIREEGGDSDVHIREIHTDGSRGNQTVIERAGETLDKVQIDINASGAYAVIFENSANGGVIDVLRFASDGSNLDADTAITVSQTSAGIQENPSLALGDDGRILAVWEGEEISGGKDDIFAREIMANGLLPGNEIVVPFTTGNNQLHPDAVLVGNLASIVWDDHGPAGNDDVMLRTLTTISPELIVVPGGVVTDEDGSFVDIGFNLATLPIADVVVSLSSSDPSEGLADKLSLTFTSANWATVQTVRVTGQADSLLDGDIAYGIDYAISSASDPIYNSLPSGTVNLTNQDTDLPIAFNVGPVTDVNTAPNEVAENSTAGTTVGVTANATDPDNAVTYSLVNNAGNRFVINPTSGVITVDVGASLDRESVDSHLVTVRALSGDGSISEQDFTIAVLDTNDSAPVISTTSFSITESAPANTILGTPTVTDPDTSGSLQNWQLVGGTGLSAFAINGSGELRLTDPSLLNHENTPILTLDIQVSDGINLSPVQTVSISIEDSAESPTGGATSISVTEDTPYPITISDIAFSDEDVGDQLSSIIINSLPVSGSLQFNGTSVAVSQVISRADIVAGDLVYYPAENAAGAAVTSIDITVVDGSGMSAASPNQITVDITAINDRPEITSYGGQAVAAVAVPENTILAATVSATDVDLPAQSLTYAIVGGADAGRFLINPGTGVLSFAAAPDFEAPTDADNNGVYEVLVQVSDGTTVNGTAAQTLSITVTNASEMLSLTFPAAVNAIEDQAMQFSGANILSVTDPDQAPNLSVSISVTDGQLSLASTDGLVFTNGDGVDDDTMTFNGSVTDINTALASLSFQPTLNDNGVETLTVAMGDTSPNPGPGQRSLSQDITINISAVNDPPVVTGNLIQTAAPDTTVVIGPATLTTTDIEDTAPALVYTVTQAPADGQLLLNAVALSAGDSFTQQDINDGHISYRAGSGIPDQNDHIILTVTDSDGASVGAISVEMQFDAPIFSEVPSDSDGGANNAARSGSTDSDSSSNTKADDTSDADGGDESNQSNWFHAGSSGGADADDGASNAAQASTLTAEIGSANVAQGTTRAGHDSNRRW
ncbi:MAG: DUF4347 domain-containing protein, partial [Burkholderiaceae bacterium]